MSCVFPYVGDFHYKEPSNFDEALHNIQTIEQDLEVIKNYLQTRKQTLEEGKKLGFASIEDYETYRNCERKITEVLQRRTNITPL